MRTSLCRFEVELCVKAQEAAAAVVIFYEFPKLAAGGENANQGINCDGIDMHGDDGAVFQVNDKHVTIAGVINATAQCLAQVDGLAIIRIGYRYELMVTRDPEFPWAPAFLAEDNYKVRPCHLRRRRIGLDPLVPSSANASQYPVGSTMVKLALCSLSTSTFSSEAFRQINDIGLDG